MRRTWFHCINCQTTHPEPYPGSGLYVCPYCSSVDVAPAPRNEVAGKLRRGDLLPLELKATGSTRMARGDTSMQANMRLTGEYPAVRAPAKRTDRSS